MRKPGFRAHAHFRAPRALTARKTSGEEYAVVLPVYGVDAIVMNRRLRSVRDTSGLIYPGAAVGAKPSEDVRYDRPTPATRIALHEQARVFGASEAQLQTSVSGF